MTDNPDKEDRELLLKQICGFTSDETDFRKKPHFLYPMEELKRATMAA
jgi:hypothetical protein